jgi:hypothetical protein
MISKKQQMENLRIDIAYTARYLSGISPKLEKHKELTQKLKQLRDRLSELKKSVHNPLETN